jgi:hypothetical protein
MAKPEEPPTPIWLVMKACDRALGFECADSEVAAALQDNDVAAASFNFEPHLVAEARGESSRSELLE